MAKAGVITGTIEGQNGQQFYDPCVTAYNANNVIAGAMMSAITAIPNDTRKPT